MCCLPLFQPYLGIFTLILYPDEVYTLTTVATGQHGAYSTPPVSKPFPLPYVDDFEGQLYQNKHLISVFIRLSF